MDIRALFGMPDLLDVRKIVCVQPHPDDNEVGAAGALMELARRGCEIVYITVTDGSSGVSGVTSTPVDSTELAVTRHAEIERAGAMIGVTKQIQLGFTDCGGYQEEEVAERLVHLFREHRPELVMTVDPWMPYEAHPDHLKTGMAVARALMFSGNSAVYPTQPGIAPCEIPQVAFYATSYPNTFVDVTADFQGKLAAIKAHTSQFDNAEWPLLAAYLADAAQEQYCIWRRDPDAKGYAESFKVLATRQLHFFPTALFS